MIANTVSGQFGNISSPALVFPVFALPDSIPSKASGNTTANDLSGNWLRPHVAYSVTNGIAAPNIQLKKVRNYVLL